MWRERRQDAANAVGFFGEGGAEDRKNDVVEIRSVWY